jgi:sulfur carrier protein
MEIVLNGQTKSLVGPVNIAGLIESLGFTGKRIAVERNGEIVPKSTYAQTMIAAGDRLEIVVAVGGG